MIIRIELTGDDWGRVTDALLQSAEWWEEDAGASHSDAMERWETAMWCRRLHGHIETCVQLADESEDM